MEGSCALVEDLNGSTDADWHAQDLNEMCNMAIQSDVCMMRQSCLIASVCGALMLRITASRQLHHVPLNQALNEQQLVVSLNVCMLFCCGISRSWLHAIVPLTAQAQTPRQWPTRICEVVSTDLVLALVGPGAPQPDLVPAEVGGDEGDDLAHGQALARPEVPRQPSRACGFQQLPQALRQLAGQACTPPGQQI